MSVLVMLQNWQAARWNNLANGGAHGMAGNDDIFPKGGPQRPASFRPQPPPSISQLPLIILPKTRQRFPCKRVCVGRLFPRGGPVKPESISRTCSQPSRNTKAYQYNRSDNIKQNQMNIIILSPKFMIHCP